MPHSNFWGCYETVWLSNTPRREQGAPYVRFDVLQAIARVVTHPKLGPLLHTLHASCQSGSPMFIFTVPRISDNEKADRAALVAAVTDAWNGNAPTGIDPERKSIRPDGKLIESDPLELAAD